MPTARTRPSSGGHGACSHSRTAEEEGGRRSGNGDSQLGEHSREASLTSHTQQHGNTHKFQMTLRHANCQYDPASSSLVFLVGNQRKRHPAICCCLADLSLSANTLKEMLSLNPELCGINYVVSHWYCAALAERRTRCAHCRTPQPKLRPRQRQQSLYELTTQLFPLSDFPAFKAAFRNAGGCCGCRSCSAHGGGADDAMHVVDYGHDVRSV